MELFYDLLPLLRPLWRRVRWKIRRCIRRVRYAIVDVLLALALMGVWYVAFIGWPAWFGPY